MWSTDDVNDTDGRRGCLPLSLSPTGLHCLTASPCCTAVPDEFRLRTRNWVPFYTRETEKPIVLQGKDFVKLLTDLHNGIHGTSLLAKAAVDTFGHVYVVSGGTSATVSPSFCLDGNSLRVEENNKQKPSQTRQNGRTESRRVRKYHFTL